MPCVAVGMAQILVEMGDPARNLTRARDAIAEAARRGCAFVVLPECLDLGWTCPAAPALAQPIPGPRSDALAAAAREFGIHVAAGLTERSADRVYNAAVLMAPSGELLLKHRKINELDIARQIYSTGESLTVAQTRYGCVAVNICADNFPDTLYLAEAQARMGAQLLLSPCAWAVDADHDNAREPYGALWKGAYHTLTTRHRITVAGVSNVGALPAGPWKGRKCIGCSLAVGPGGRILAEAPYGEEALVLFEAELALRQARGAGCER